MAKDSNLPGFYEKRKLRFSTKLSPAKRHQTAEAFVQAGRFDEALDLLARPDSADFVRRIANLAFEAGNVPLFMRAKKMLGVSITDEEWTRLARTAEAAGRPSMALVAHLKAGHQDEAARLRALIESLAPVIPGVPGAPGSAPAAPAPGEALPASNEPSDAQAAPPDNAQ